VVGARRPTPPPPRVFVPLSDGDGVRAPLCDWRASAPQDGPPPASAAALAARVLHAPAQWPAARGSGAPVCASPSGCHVVTRSAPMFMSRGALAFEAAGDSAQQARLWSAAVRSCAA
jgi:hypothetical protein